MSFFSSLFASQRRKKVPKKEEKTQLFSTSSLRSAVFGGSVSPNFFCPLLWVHFIPKKEEKTQLFSTSSLRSAVFGSSVSPNFLSASMGTQG